MFKIPADCLLAWQLQIAEFRENRRFNQSINTSPDNKTEVEYYTIGDSFSKTSNTSINSPKYCLRATPGDGDCFFHAVNKPGFDRAALIKKLSENSQNPTVLKAFGIEIRQFLYIACTGKHEVQTDQFAAEKMLKKAAEFKKLLENLEKTETALRSITASARVKLGFENTKGKIASEILEMLTSHRLDIVPEFKRLYDAVEKANREIIQVCQTPEVFNNYIEYYLRDAKGFIPFSRDFTGDR